MGKMSVKLTILLANHLYFDDLGIISLVILILLIELLIYIIIAYFFQHCNSIFFPVPFFERVEPRWRLNPFEVVVGGRDIDGDIMVYADDLAYWRGKKEVVRSFCLVFGGGRFKDEKEKTVIMDACRKEEGAYFDGGRIKNTEYFKSLRGFCRKNRGCMQEMAERVKVLDSMIKEKTCL